MDIQLILSKYDSGQAFTKIAKELKSSPSKIRKILIDNSRTIRNLSQSHEIYDYDKSFFKKIDSEDKAYLLGFLYADGNVCKNVMQICLHSKDIEVLEYFKNSLKSNHKIVNDRGYKRFRIGNEELISDLNKLGVIERKTFDIKFPNSKILPEYLIRHFIRGYFDGDGSINYSITKKYQYLNWSFGIISCFDFISQVNLIISHNCNIRLATLEREKRRNNPIYTIRHGGHSKSKLKKIYNFLYEDASIFLKRKKEKFEYIINFNE
jgi:intein-encoded DNA endonuclease-like protein